MKREPVRQLSLHLHAYLSLLKIFKQRADFQSVTMVTGTCSSISAYFFFLAPPTRVRSSLIFSSVRSVYVTSVFLDIVSPRMLSRVCFLAFTVCLREPFPRLDCFLVLIITAELIITICLPVKDSTCNDQQKHPEEANKHFLWPPAD